MRIRYLKYNQIDKEKWDACIRYADNHLPYAYSWYLDIVTQNWDGLVLDDYSAVMPLCHNKKLLGFQQLYQPVFCQQLGVFSKEQMHENEIKEFVRSIPASFRLVNILLNEKNPILSFDSFTIYRKTNLINSLNKPYEELKHNYSDNHKRNTGKAKRRNLRLDKEHRVEDILNIYKLEQGSKAGLAAQDYLKIRQLMEILLEHKLAFIRSVYSQENELLLSMFFIHSQNRIINIFGSSTELGRKNKAMYFCIDSIFEEFAGTETLFDFEGSSIPGVAYFFKGFGPEKRFYHQVIHNRLPNWLNTLRSFRGWIKS